MIYPCPRPETFDYITNPLHDKPETLRECSLASKVPRARMHLLAKIKFPSEKRVKSWMKSLPDPSNSPVYHIRTLLLFLLRGDGSPGTRSDSNLFSRCTAIPESFDEPEISRRVPRISTLPQVTPRGFSSPLPMGFSTSSIPSPCPVATHCRTITTTLIGHIPSFLRPHPRLLGPLDSIHSKGRGTSCTDCWTH